MSISIAAYEAMIEQFADCQSELTAERERADRAEADAVEAWRQVHLFKTEAGGPDGFATWKDAAINERLRRVKAEAEAARLLDWVKTGPHQMGCASLQDEVPRDQYGSLDLCNCGKSVALGNNKSTS